MPIHLSEHFRSACIIPPHGRHNDKTKPRHPTYPKQMEFDTSTYASNSMYLFSMPAAYYIFTTSSFVMRLLKLPAFSNGKNSVGT